MTALLLWACAARGPVRPLVATYECGRSGLLEEAGRRCWWDTCRDTDPFTPTSTGLLHWVSTSDGRWWECDLRQGQVCAQERAEAAAWCERYVRPEYPSALYDGDVDGLRGGQ